MAVTRSSGGCLEGKVLGQAVVSARVCRISPDLGFGSRPFRPESAGLAGDNLQ